MGIQMMPGKGGRRSLDTTINLVPMIDMLIVCISFLLITAVWTQLARLNVMQQMPGPPDTNNTEEQKARYTVRINDQGFVIMSSQGDSVAIPKKDQKYDFVKLRSSLKDIHGKDPDKRDIVFAPEDGILYDNIIVAMDVALQENFPLLSVADGSSL